MLVKSENDTTKGLLRISYEVRKSFDESKTKAFDIDLTTKEALAVLRLLKDMRKDETESLIKQFEEL